MRLSEKKRMRQLEKGACVFWKRMCSSIGKECVSLSEKDCVRLLEKNCARPLEDDCVRVLKKRVRHSN